MLKYLEPVLKGLCLVLGIFLLLQLAKVVQRKNPLAEISIPDLPALVLTNALATNSKPSAAVSLGTNQVGTSSGGTNVAIPVPGSTNFGLTNVLEPKIAGTNLPGTNSAFPMVLTNKLSDSTNVIPLLTNTLASTNLSGSNTSGLVLTNTLVKSMDGSSVPQLSGGPPGPGMRGGQPTKAPTLPPEVQARLDRIVQAEILAPVMRPMPMALLGIAGPDVFLRGPNGETGMIREGKELGGVKLLRIGPNRVLVEHEGQQKELTIFQGIGGESLLPKQP